LSSRIPKWLELGYQIVVTSDHGMDFEGIHGGATDDERIVPLWIIGSSVEMNTLEPLNQLIIEPLLSRLLNIEPGEEMIDIRKFLVE